MSVFEAADFDAHEKYRTSHIIDSGKD